MYKKLVSFFHFFTLPAELQNRHGDLLLHIGDIPIWEFPYMKRLIRKVKPDILVHTGDLVDNLKVSRIPGDIPAYKKHAASLIAHMEKYAKEVYIVPGNNDLEAFLSATVTKSKIIPANTCMEIRGIPFLLCHRVLDIDGEAKCYLYGHGPTGDTHPFAENGRDGKYYSNVFFAPAFIDLHTEKISRLPAFKRR